MCHAMEVRLVIMGVDVQQCMFLTPAIYLEVSLVMDSRWTLLHALWTYDTLETLLR